MTIEENISRKNRWIMVFLIMLYCILCYSVFLLDRETILALGTEDGLLEYLGSLYFFLTSVLFLILYGLGSVK